MRNLVYIFTTSLVIGVAGIAQAAVEITPARIEESRSVKLVEDNIGHQKDALKITFSLKGPEAESSVKYGDLKLDEAVDDAGTNLIPAKDAFNEADKFKEYSNAFFRKFDLEAKRTAADPQIDMNLGLPKRSATKIAHLRGTFSLAQAGTIKTVELASLKSAGQKKLDIPAEAGVEITVTVKPGKANSIDLAITGDENALESIEVVDAAGTKVSNGISSWSFNGGPAQKTLDLEKPLDDTMKLVAKVAVGRKITKVPFDLKDITLP